MKAEHHIDYAGYGPPVDPMGVHGHDVKTLHSTQLGGVSSGGEDGMDLDNDEAEGDEYDPLQNY